MEDKFLPATPATALSLNQDDEREVMLARLDAIIRELQELRCALRRVLRAHALDAPQTAAPLTHHLSGILAPPTEDASFDVLEEYRSSIIPMKR